jgi:mannose-1-phosphate guanylyltransferase
VVPVDHIVTVVAAQHRRWWRRELLDLPPENIVAQPANKGTAAGLLLPLTEVMKRDPLATVVVLPSDHHVADEEILKQTILAAFRAVDADDGRVVLLGIAPRECDADYGWIMPSGYPGTVQRVTTFVEKPAPELAARLMEQGGLLNSMIIAANGATLLRLYARAVPLLLERFVAWRSRAGSERGKLESLYVSLDSCDFSREVLERRCDDLCVLRVPGCGWADLGTPARLGLYRQQQSSIPKDPSLRNTA